MSENLHYWNLLKRPPASALKPIMAGRLKGKSDINPQWRIEAMTAAFGPAGFGWTYRIVRQWLERGHGDEVAAFTEIELRIRVNGEWSEPIPGVGGSMFVAQESRGPYTSDEAHKMSLTDALSVAMKQLGVAADIYAGLWDGSKYRDPPQSHGIGKLDRKNMPPPDADEPIREDFADKIDAILKGLASGDDFKVYENATALNNAEKLKARNDGLLGHKENAAIRTIIESVKKAEA